MTDGAEPDGTEGSLEGRIESEGPIELVEPSTRARRSARRWILIGTGLFSLALPVLYLVCEIPLADAILLAVLLTAVPGFALAQIPLVDEIRIERLPAYWSSIATLWILGTASWLVGSREGGPAALGLVGLPVAPFVMWTLGLTGAGLLVIAVFHGIARGVGVVDSDLLVQLLPRSTRERGVFTLLSVAAGAAEELAYRGYTIPALAPLLGVGGAAALSTAVFGLMHAYQGALGVVRTGFMGAVLAWGFLASGSLWPAVVAHTLIDVVAGIWLGEKLLVTPKG